MYPIVRFIKEMVKFSHAEKLAIGGVHRSSHICWPWDIDPWLELNNGRALTLYDLGRIPMTRRSGLLLAMRENSWGMAVAGASVRYRRRVRAFHRFTIQSTILGWDGRFFYFQQSMWRQDEALSSLLVRMAVTDAAGIVAPKRVALAMGWSEDSPDLPEYVKAWIDAEATRPWPPTV